MIKSNISTLEIDGDSALLTIENGRKNLLSRPEFIDRELFSKFISDHPQLKSLIITGASKQFSHGVDISRLVLSDSMSAISSQLNAAKELLDIIENLSIVTVAAIDGGCFGGGLEIALSCQFRICARNASFGIPEVMHGIMSGMNGLERLTQVVGRRKAIELALSGATISASDACDMGLVDKISDKSHCLQEAFRFAKELTDGKTVSQINHIIETINAASRGENNASDGRFEKLLFEKWERE